MTEPIISKPSESSSYKNKIIFSVIVVALLGIGLFGFLKIRYSEQMRVRLEQERAQKFEIYKNTLNQILSNLNNYSINWKAKNNELYGLGKYNDDQVIIGSDGWNSISGKKEKLGNEIKEIESKMIKLFQEGLDLSNNYYNDNNADPLKKDIAKQKISYFSNALMKANNIAGNSNAGIAINTGNFIIDKAQTEFPGDQKLRGLVEQWKGYKITYDNMEKDLSDRVEAGLLQPIILQNHVSSPDYRANQRAFEKLIYEHIDSLRSNR